MNLKQKLYDLLGKHKGKVQEAQKAVEAGELDKAEALTNEAKSLAGEIEKVKALIAEEERYGEGDGGDGQGTRKGLHIQTAGDGEDGYQKAVKAFAQAAREGFPRQKAAGDMMQEGVDADGGYTVPSDIVTKIIELRSAKESLLDEVQVIPVTTKSGRRTMKKRGGYLPVTNELLEDSDNNITAVAQQWLADECQRQLKILFFAEMKCHFW